MSSHKELVDIAAVKPKILEYLGEHGEARIGALTNQLKKPRYNILLALRQLEDEGKIVSKKSPIIVEGVQFGYKTTYRIVNHELCRDCKGIVLKPEHQDDRIVFYCAKMGKFTTIDKTGCKEFEGGL